ncbi:hypothetical protein G6F59_014550 [Rhizopus arrhizus]|nr:hypothetical protein G6F59_014550 [Rhizopus arrhizus]
MRGIGPGGSEESVGPRGGGFGQRGRFPLRVAGLVDQQGADAFGKIAVGGAMQRGDVFQPVDAGQVLAGAAPLQFERQPRRTGCTGGEGLLCRLQPRIVGLQAADPVNDGGQVIAFAQRVDLRRVGQQRAGNGGAGMRLQQLAQALVVVRGIARPGHLQQRIEHRAAAFFGHVHVGQAGVDGIARIQQRAGQGQEQATLARYARQQPAATHIGEQAHGDFRERQLGALADHAVAGAGHQADAAAHHDAMAPAQDRLGNSAA